MLEIGVLNRPTVAGNAGPYAIAVVLKRQRDQSRMPEQAVYCRRKRAEHDAITGRERRGRWTILGADAPIARAEYHCRECDIVVTERRARGEPHLDDRSG